MAANIEPFELVFRSEEVMPEIAKLVVVAEVEVARVVRRSEIVDEAVERKPFKKARVVEVAFSLVLSLVKGKTNPGEEERLPLVRVKFEPIVRALKEPSAPMYGIFESRVEAVTARFVVVACSLPACLVNGQAKVIEDR